MKPIIQGELDALRRKIDELEAKLKKPEYALGHRSIFHVGSSGEVPKSPGGVTKFLREDGKWVEVAASGGGTVAISIYHVIEGI